MVVTGMGVMVVTGMGVMVVGAVCFTVFSQTLQVLLPSLRNAVVPRRLGVFLNGVSIMVMGAMVMGVMVMGFRLSFSGMIMPLVGAMVVTVEELQNGRRSVRLHSLLLEGKRVRNHVKQSVAKHRTGRQREQQMHLSAVKLLLGKEKHKTNQRDRADS